MSGDLLSAAVFLALALFVLAPAVLALRPLAGRGGRRRLAVERGITDGTRQFASAGVPPYRSTPPAQGRTC